MGAEGNRMEKTDMIEKKDKFTIGNLDLYYGDFHALKGINLNIHPNRSLRSRPSGCGKSTLRSH